MTAPACTARRHGNNTAYRKDHCRCPAAVAAATRRRKEWELRVLHLGHSLLIDATGTKRRLHALAVLGWSYAQLGEQVGMPDQAVRRWYRAGERVHLDTARRVAAVYERLYATPSDAPRACQVTALARAKGWHGPEAWTDANIDDPNARPLRQVRRGQALYEDATWLLGQGMDRAQVAERLGITRNYVDMVLARGRRQEAGAA